MFNRDELLILEELLNEEILSCLKSGTPLQDNYIIILRDMLFRLNLKETYNFERWEIKWLILYQD